MYFLLGILPEVILFTVFLSHAKELKSKRFLLFTLLLLSYCGLKFVFRYSVYFNLSFIFVTYLILRVLYSSKAKVTDIFLINLASIVLILISCFTYFTISDYFISMIVNRLLIIPICLLSKNVLRKYYLLYNSVWNRNRVNPNKIKSLTVRNTSIIIFNCMIFLVDLLLRFVL